jgi:hypothetical protein
MTYLLILGALLCGWSLLRVLGGERERRVHELDAEHAAAAAGLQAADAPAPRP